MASKVYIKDVRGRGGYVACDLTLPMAGTFTAYLTKSGLSLRSRFFLVDKGRHVEAAALKEKDWPQDSDAHPADVTPLLGYETEDISGRYLLVLDEPPPVSGGDDGQTAMLSKVWRKLDDLQRDVTAVQRDLTAIQRELAAEDASSLVSPAGKEYERIVDALIDSWLSTFCGLRVVPSGRRGIPHTDPAAGNQQWDARFSVTLIALWTPPAAGDIFRVYGGGNYRIPAVTPLRTLSPTKTGLPDAQYFAVLEYTSFPSWTHTWIQEDTHKRRNALPPRLEKRLAICHQRAKDAGNTCPSVLDAVALVGVVGVDDCLESVEALLSSPSCEWKLLKEMYEAKRFVFFYCFPASSRARVQLLAGTPTSAAMGGAGGPTAGR